MRVLSAACLLLAAALGAGCTSVSVPQPFGQPATRQETAQLLGHWIADGDQQSILTVVRDSQDELQLGTMQWKEDEDRFVVHQERLHLRRVGELQLVFLEAKDETPSGDQASPKSRYGFARFEVTAGGQLKLWWAKADYLKAAVESGELTGVMKQRDLQLAGPGDELERYFLKHAESCFQEEPFTEIHRAH